MTQTITGYNSKSNPCRAPLSAEEQLRIWNDLIPGLAVGDARERFRRPLHPCASHSFIMPSPYAIANSPQAGLRKLLTLKRESIRFDEWLLREEFNDHEYDDSLYAFHEILERDRVGDFWVIQVSFKNTQAEYRGGDYEAAGILLTHPRILQHDSPGSCLDCPGVKISETGRGLSRMVRFFKRGNVYWMMRCTMSFFHTGRSALGFFVPGQM
ncbi:hypothetical protein HY621_01145 [Candidatus Uhrbacteria bacterium]|nr:hypothetical protein [Candidatus Uhrbacteria bacterium]